MENFVYVNVDSGILYGHWTPIYGVGTLSIIFINKYIDKVKLNKIAKALLLFILCSFVLSIIETIGGYFIEIVYGRIFWNYSSHTYPIGKYTSLKMMGLWGIASLFLIYVLLPLTKKLFDKIPKYVTIIFIILFIIDLIYTFIKISNFTFI